MRYAEFLERTHFSREELIALSYGTLVTEAPDGFIRLPTPPILIMTRITEVEHRGAGGRIVGEHEVRFDEWFFHGHFLGDPVQPGCLVLDAAWGVMALYGALRGGLGNLRALGCGEMTFSKQIRPFNRLVRYEVDVRRCMDMRDRGAFFLAGDARITVDGEEACTVKGARFGLFRGIAYSSYPQVLATAVPPVVSQGGA